MKRRSFGLAAAALCTPPWARAGAAASPSGEARVLRYAFSVAETGFDPAQVNDLYSRIINAHVFEAPYTYDYLARPFKLRPNTAEAMPQVSPDFKTWTVRIRPGVHFADDEAFKGQRRELVAQDYVYAWKRFFDPANKSPTYSNFNEEGVIGADELRQQALKSNKPFDYDRELEGIRALDRYTLQFKLKKPRPRLIYTLADSSLFGAVAREVVEHYGDKIAEHPVGTGPFRIAAWRRSSQIVLERNPNYREVLYDAEPNADDAEGQALLRRFKGRRLPMVDRVEVAIIEESQPRWLSFLNREFDLVQPVPLEFSLQALAGEKLAPHLVKRGVQMERIVNPDMTLFYFNMEDPVVGGYTAEKVALRRAISLAYDVQREIIQVRRGQAIPAQSMVSPGTYGYDPQYKSANSDYSVSRAKALLDLYGYVDRDGDGWRELPNGQPLVLQYATTPDSISRQFDEIWKKCMDEVGIRLQFKTAKWPEQLKAARSAQLMVWQLGYTSASPEVQETLQILYGPASGGQNLARFKHARFDEIYERLQVLPDGPERLALLHEAMNIVTAFAPQKYNVHRIVTDLSQPWLIGYRRPLYSRQFWHYVDIDNSLRASR
ncbi:MAG TPA: ABC transporter substrate-binding protein [Albitalea sp.]|nr:ABC transporter substrate-binding protein [Albitalea sp.]